MKQRTKEWIAKAEGDWTIAQRERLADDPVWDGISFLVQQCAEKYLKAFLEEHGVLSRRHTIWCTCWGRRGDNFPL